jgi:XRE family aerobic/anaerobic benzoate catabolism transcriptional regulator
MPGADLMQPGVTLAARLRAARRQRGLSRRQLAETSQVSMRYLALLESGDGNVSVAVLCRIAAALDIPVAHLLQDGDGGTLAGDMATRFATATPHQKRAILEILGVPHDNDAPDRRRRIALVGVRGGGKSTLGRLASARLDVPFREVSDGVERLAGMPVSEVVALYGQDGLRLYEATSLAELAAQHDELIIAVGGGIVETEANFDFLLSHFHTIWVHATPADHIARVSAQGDDRPMRGYAEAERHLEVMLSKRMPQFARTDAALDTSRRDVDSALAALLDIMAPWMAGNVAHGAPARRKAAIQNAAK